LRPKGKKPPHTGFQALQGPDPNQPGHAGPKVRAWEAQERGGTNKKLRGNSSICLVSHATLGSRLLSTSMHFVKALLCYSK
jgi:hypothetical protein